MQGLPGGWQAAPQAASPGGWGSETDALRAASWLLAGWLPHAALARLLRQLHSSARFCSCSSPHTRDSSVSQEQCSSCGAGSQRRPRRVCCTNHQAAVHALKLSALSQRRSGLGSFHWAMRRRPLSGQF